MTDNQSQTESILEIVRAIENKSIVLPEFQRDFRWEMEKTFDLFNSLVRGILHRIGDLWEASVYHIGS